MRVLFVEDSEVNRRVIKEMLRAAGIEMEEAEEGAAGLAMIEAHDYDLILMDLRMPGMDGMTAIRHIRARSPQARGRSERAFGTIQGRLPQELRVAGITDYAAANTYLSAVFVPDFNRRFTVRPAQPERAFVKVVGIDLRLVLSAQHERVVRNDSTVQFGPLTLQLPPTRWRPHYVRCPVIVHEFPDDTLGISYQHRLLARYDRRGVLLEAPAAKGKAA